MYWQPGQTLQNGKYQIQEVLGGGGFGATYRAISQSKDQRPVVIKTLNAKLQNKPDFQEQQVKFVNEALFLAKCKHPHIIETHKEEDLY